MKKSFFAAGAVFLSAANAAFTAFLNKGRRVVSLDENTLLQESCRQSGLDDFGDEAFRLPLGILLQSFERDADLNLVGRICARSETVRMLCNRLRMVEDEKNYLQIREEPIVRPLFITGLPRSGTSFLHAVLAQDPGCRAPQVWEVQYPSPPPETSSYSSDPRICKTEKRLWWLNLLMPEFERFHMIDARYPQECIAITDHAFMSYVFESMYQVSSYRIWHDRQDKRPAYEFHHRFLQHLQFRCPGTHWVLKSPSHLMALDALLHVYPDADIVVTHRDPLKVLPSCSSFTRVLRRPFTNQVDQEALRSDVNLRWEEASRSLIRFRENNPRFRGRFHDVRYPDLMRDPMAVIRQIYGQLERKLTKEAEAAMERFVRANPKDKNGRHHYSLTQFGYDEETERRRFQFYTDHYGISPER